MSATLKAYLAEVFFTDLSVIGIVSIWQADEIDPKAIKQERRSQFVQVHSTFDQKTKKSAQGSSADIKALLDRATRVSNNEPDEPGRQIDSRALA